MDIAWTPGHLTTGDLIYVLGVFWYIYLGLIRDI